MIEKHTLFGIPVIVHPAIKPVPAIQIDPDFKWCSDEFRAKHNAWLLERFGTVRQMLMMTDPSSGQQIVVMSPEEFKALRENYVTTPGARMNT